MVDQVDALVTQAEMDRSVREFVTQSLRQGATMEAITTYVRMAVIRGQREWEKANRPDDPNATQEMPAVGDG